MLGKTFRRGDMVTASGIKSIPEGTIGKVMIAPSQPTVPRSLYVEWLTQERPNGLNRTKRSWHHETELAPLASD